MGEKTVKILMGCLGLLLGLVVVPFVVWCTAYVVAVLLGVPTEAKIHEINTVLRPDFYYLCEGDEQVLRDREPVVKYLQTCAVEESVRDCLERRRIQLGATETWQCPQ